MKKSTLLCLAGMAVATVALTGCASSSSSEPSSGIVGTIPATSKFAKIMIGMPMKQVFDTIGAPTDTRAYVTGKAWIPFYYGSDTARSEALYKGEGRITFAGGSGLAGGAYKVHTIVYDPAEDGYAN